MISLKKFPSLSPKSLNKYFIKLASSLIVSHAFHIVYVNNNLRKVNCKLTLERI